jgi:DNA-binding NtrC family response regulator
MTSEIFNQDAGSSRSYPEISMRSLAVTKFHLTSGPIGNRHVWNHRQQPALESVLAEVERVAPTDSTVLVLGETCTGKELIARAIHNSSPRCGRPFMKLNCAAIPFDLLESELFGHEKGAFTGAMAQKIGRFEMADAGTVPR